LSKTITRQAHSLFFVMHTRKAEDNMILVPTQYSSSHEATPCLSRERDPQDDNADVL